MYRFLALAAATAPELTTGCSSLPETASPPGPTRSPGSRVVKLADFKGITTDGTVIPGLFPIRPTGIPNAEVVTAATKLLNLLTDAERENCHFDLASDQWLNWSPAHNFPRNGLRLREMTAEQQNATSALLRAALSPRGFATVEKVRQLNHVAGRLIGRPDLFAQDLYFLVLFGRPSAVEPWGFQLQGSHLVLNCLMRGDQVVATPTLLGAEPRIGRYDDERIELFAEELAAGLAMIRSLDPAQQAKATVHATKPVISAEAELGKDNAVLPYQGIRSTELTPAQREQLLSLISLLLSYLDDAHAAVKLTEVKAHLDDTWFSWVGPTGDESPFYYRIQSPVLLIELDCQGPGPAAEAGTGGSLVARNHVHLVIRTPNANDYGRALVAA